MNRPLAWLAVSLVLGILATLFLDLPLVVTYVVFLVVTVGLCVAHYLEWRKVAAVLIPLAFVLLGATRAGLEMTRLRSTPLADELAPYLGGRVTLRGVVRKADLYREDRPTLRLVLETPGFGDKDNEPSLGKCQVIWCGPTQPIRPGDVVEVAARVYRAGYGDRVRDQYTNFLMRNRIEVVVSGNGEGAVRVVGQDDRYFRARLVHTFRTHLFRTVSASVPPGRAWFIAAVWLGDRGALSDEMQDKFIRTGTYHITAVSGIHLVIVSAVISVLLGILMPGRDRVRAVVTLLAIAAFAVMTGLRVPVLRASIMIGVYYLSHVFKREPDRLTSLSLAALILLLAEPLNIFNKGFIFSFAAAATLVILTPFLETYRSGTFGRVIEILVVSCAIHVVSLPLVISSFEYVSPVAVFANLVVIPLMTPVLFIALISSVLGSVYSGLAILFNSANSVVVWLLFAVVDVCDSLPFAHFRLIPPTVASSIAYYLALMVVLRIRRPRLGRREPINLRPVYASAALVLLAVALYVPGFFHRDLELVFFDVGQGDAALMRFPGGMTALVDAGPPGKGYGPAQRVIEPWLFRNRIVKLDNVFVTHAHDDHIGGMPYLLEKIKVGTVFYNGIEGYTDSWDEVKDVIERKEIPFRVLARGDVLSYDNGRVLVEVLNPAAGAVHLTDPDLNETSLVLRVAYGNVSCLLTGDIESDAETDLCAQWEQLDADVIKVPHHGSESSSTPEFVARVDPDIAVVTVGRRNRFGLPDEPVIERYENAGALVLRTDIDGTIRLRTDGRVISYVTSPRDAARRRQGSVKVRDVVLVE